MNRDSISIEQARKLSAHSKRVLLAQLLDACGIYETAHIITSKKKTE